jgi:cobalamin synthase
LKLLRDLGSAFSYFSILPVGHGDQLPDDGAIAFLPLVGLVIGALSGLGAYGVWLLSHIGLAAAIVAWLLSIALSGAIHVDGFLDCCDGLFAMAPPERRLEIMRDPRHGTYALVGMAIVTVVWLYALVQIPPDMLPVTLAVTGTFPRWGAVLLRSRNHGLAAVLGFVLSGAVGFLVLLFARPRLGGVVNGDCYGAAIVVSEMVMLLAVPYVVFPHPVVWQ